MTKLLRLFAVVLLAACSTLAVACGDKKVDPVIIVVDAEEYAITEETTLNDYMNMLKLDGKLEFTSSLGSWGTFITSVNGVSNGIGNNPCWMVYTDDPNFIDSEWGTEVIINGKSYTSASVGISYITVSDGCSYVLFYQSFSYSE